MVTLGDSELIVKPLVSVVVPAFNSADYLHRSIMSVVGQSYKNWELIVVDDGSFDSTNQILRDLTKLDKRISFFERPKNRKKGANACRNLGIEKSSGEYVAFLDSDDEWQKDRLENAMLFIREHKTKAIYSGAEVCSHDSIIIRKSRAKRANEVAFDFILNSTTFAPTPSLIVNSAILLLSKFDEDLQRHQDYDFFVSVSEVTDWMYFENYDVTIHWAHNPFNKKIDFVSCSAFYEKHSFKSRDQSVRINYLIYILESCAKLNPSTFALKFYKDELLKEGVSLNLRQRFIVGFPFLFQKLYLIKTYFICKRKFFLR